MVSLKSGYQSFMPYNENDAETPQESGVMIHVVPESGKARWNHIEDLDSFFTRSQRLPLSSKAWVLLYDDPRSTGTIFVFVVLFSTFLLECVSYSVLFGYGAPKFNSTVHKVRLSDAVIPPGQCIGSLSPTIVICLLVALVFWLLRLVKVAYHMLQYLEIKAFYSSALHILPEELDNMTWHEVQKRLLEVQCEQQMCIHKRELSELDIYHRILRFKNYMIAMVNKELLPVKFHLPLIGDMVFLSKGLKYNLEMILFWGPWAPFENSWHLREDYKKAEKKHHLASELSKHILWIGIANLLLCPLVFLWQVLYSFFSYAESIKREPGALGARRWSQYGRLYLRHFNELDHELNARLCRGYKLAHQYMSIFSSHLLAIIAKNVAFFAGSLLAVLIALTIWDSDVLTMDHVLTAITVLGAVVATCRVFIPDEHLVWCPERLMTGILAHIHYMPDHWRGNAHTYGVRDEFAQLFHYRALYLLEELLSPIVTPIILCFHLRSRVLDIVDFFHNFTVEVVGVGDVCSFAQMDVRRHGNTEWQSLGQMQASQSRQAENGKTELSLMHFTLTNPHWIPSQDASIFLANLKEQAQRDADQLHSEENPLYYSLHSLSSLGGGYNDLFDSILRSGFQSNTSESHRSAKGGVAHAEGPLDVAGSGGLLTSLQLPQEVSSAAESTVANMSLSTIYLHQLHAHHARPLPPTTSTSLWQQQPQRSMPGIAESPCEDEEGGGPRGEHLPLLRDRLAKSS